MFSVRFALRVSVYASALRGSLYNRAVLRSRLPHRQTDLRFRLPARLPRQTRMPNRLRACQPAGLPTHNPGYSTRRVNG